MNPVREEIEIPDDEALRRAKLTKLTMETVLLAVTTIVYAKFLLSDDMKYEIKRRLKKFRYSYFGLPPLNEKQIQEIERQVLIEAMRTVRYGQ